MNWFRLKTCIKCQGDLAADYGVGLGCNAAPTTIPVSNKSTLL